jgi:hypothetical protein
MVIFFLKLIGIGENYNPLKEYLNFTCLKNSGLRTKIKGQYNPALNAFQLIKTTGSRVHIKATRTLSGLSH